MLLFFKVRLVLSVQQNFFKFKKIFQYITDFGKVESFSDVSLEYAYDLICLKHEFKKSYFEGIFFFHH